MSPVTSVAVYVHIPWCASLCPYCDFDKQASDFRLVDQYIDALVHHLELTPVRCAHSLYLGGGTPSLLTAPRLARIVDAWRRSFPPTPGAEVSVEANPSDIVAHKVEAYLRAGMTRLSLGVQSLDDAELRFLGRRHTADKAVRAVRAAREAGCADISVDLMYGLPSQTRATPSLSLQGLLDLGPDHISCYALTLEANTSMGAQAASGRLRLPDDDLVADQYAAIQTTLEAAGFAQYEISNWARPGHVSVHNLTYWRNGEYVGVGAGAAGSLMGVRYKRTPIVRDYVAAAARGEPAYVECEPWTRERTMRDTVMLGLRLSEGVADTDFRARFGVGLRDYCGDRLDGLVGAGILHSRDGRLALDPSRRFVCNAVLSEILPG